MAWWWCGGFQRPLTEQANRQAKEAKCSVYVLHEGHTSLNTNCVRNIVVIELYVSRARCA